MKVHHTLHLGRHERQRERADEDGHEAIFSSHLDKRNPVVQPVQGGDVHIDHSPDIAYTTR